MGPVQSVRILHLNISRSNLISRRGETSMTDIFSGIGSALRPVAKELIKGGIYLFDSLAEVASEAGEQFKDLVAEAKADLAKQNGKPSAKEPDEDHESTS